MVAAGIFRMTGGGRFLKWLFRILGGIFLALLMLFSAMWIGSYLNSLGYHYNGKILKFLAILAVLPLIGIWELLKSVFRKSSGEDSPVYGQQQKRRRKFYKSYKKSHYRDKNKIR